MPHEFMDKSLERLATLVSTLQASALSPTVMQATLVRIVDTLGCALAAHDAEPCLVGKRLALRARVDGGARVLGTRERALPELAAFANSLMGRYLDGNDTYLGGGGHPSDIIPAVLSVADAERADGQTLLAAIVAGYEAYRWVFQATQAREKGWDHGLFTAVGAAAGAARAMALDIDRTAQAIAMAATASHSLLVTRRGSLSEWKGCAAPYAARDGVMCALLAAEGIRGPEKPFEGVSGLFENFPVATMPAAPGDSETMAITLSHLKSHLCYYHAQTPIEVAQRVHRRLGGDAIESVDVWIYEAKGLSEREPEKWHPRTRSTADHSIPFIVAAVLLDGRFGDEIFTAERIADPHIHALTDRIRIFEDAGFSKGFPEKSPCRLVVTTRGGLRIEEAAEYPRGHALSPLSVDEVTGKFRELAARALPPQQVSQALAQILDIGSARNLDALFEAMVLPDTPVAQAA